MPSRSSSRLQLPQTGKTFQKKSIHVVVRHEIVIQHFIFHMISNVQRLIQRGGKAMTFLRINI